MIYEGILIPNFEFICIFFRGKNTLRYCHILSSFPSVSVRLTEREFGIKTPSNKSTFVNNVNI